MPFRHIRRSALTSIVAATITLGPAIAGQTNAQSVQYKSPAGVEYRSLPDTDAVKSARAALEADPKSISKIIDLGVPSPRGSRSHRHLHARPEIEPTPTALFGGAVSISSCVN